MRKTIPQKTTVSIVVLFVVITPLFVAEAASLQITSTFEYNQYVHTQINSERGNVTALDKPVFPVMINSSQIEVGSNWTVTCPLEAGHNYHIYCYGSWVNTSTSAKTDYDLYIYSPSGSLESSHTSAAGFPESIGEDGAPFFTPKQSGNHSFLIKNDARDSEGEQQATFMIIENLECNKWYTTNVEGKTLDGQSKLHTAWAYEFATNQSTVQVFLKVPNALDMYEARLYLMNDQKSLTLNSYPLAWEQGLYSNVSGVVGGYNFEPDGYRGVSYVGCEYMGQEMFLNYTTAASNKGMKLYHLVVIGEEGQGDVEFMMKTNFDIATLKQIDAASRILPDMPVKVAYESDGASLVQANISYTGDAWETVDTLTMDVANQTCNATIPGQKAGTDVEYRIDVSDLLTNFLSVSGNYSVKAQPKLNLTLAEEEIWLGENVTVSGKITPNDKNSKVIIIVFSANTTQSIDCKINSDGTFNASFQPDASGEFSVLASAPETKTSWTGDSSQLLVTVKEPPLYVKYSLYIVIGLVAALAAGGAVYYLKFMRS